jgi:DNA repair protein RadC
MKKEPKRLSIKQWAEGDRPREKMINKGKRSLSDAELIAILIGSGNEKESAVDLAKRILKNVNDNLIELSKMNINELMKFRGIGEARAINIVAALELGRRRQSEKALEKGHISCSKDIYEYFAGIIETKYEEFWIALMDRANTIIKAINISIGGVSGTVVDPKKVFKIALEYGASSVIFCHNHPSGNIQPSDSDKHLTTKLKDAGNLLDIRVLDHIIMGDNTYFSFADEGFI